jgi:cell division protein FtsI/penicillin-binding protein 2
MGVLLNCHYMDHSIPEKANRVLNFIILGLLLILIRVWYLAVIQRDEHVEAAKKPQRRTVLEQVDRGTVRDRFNIPLAINKIQYNAAVCYADIRQIPRTKWQKNEEGKSVRVPVRSLYIQQLSQLLARELDLDSQSIEDTIHGKASLFPHTPFVIKEEISEEAYYRLKMLEKDWVGIRTEQGSKRVYPLGKVGSDVIGYMGAINAKEYLHIAQELKILKEYIASREAGEIPFLPKGFENPLEVREKLKGLQEKAYTINALVGKTGIEGAFDAELRGYVGKKIFEVDNQGNLLRELPGSRKKIAGQRILLAISSELQEYAEQLLAEHEQLREARHSNGTPSLSSPWIKGGAIVAMIPSTGEVLTIASYPRSNPNDFIPSGIPEEKAEKQAMVSKWLENESYIGDIWDGKRMLERERYHPASSQFYEEKLALSHETYLEAILPSKSPILSSLANIPDLNLAAFIQREVSALLALSSQPDLLTLIHLLYSGDAHRVSRALPKEEAKMRAKESLLTHAQEVAEHKRNIDPFFNGIKFNDDKLLLLDVLRLIADSSLIQNELLEYIGPLSLSSYRGLTQAAATIQSVLQSHAKEWFHNIDFQQWREVHFKEFLLLKRKEEKEHKKYARPYPDYLDQQERMMFKEWWEKARKQLLQAAINEAIPDEASPSLEPYFSRVFALLKQTPGIKEKKEALQQVMTHLPNELQLPFLNSLRSYQELNAPLYTKYRSLRNLKGVQLQKHLAAAFYPLTGFGYGRSQAYRQSTPQGSVFKLVVAYEALVERYQELKEQSRTLSELNPLTLIDKLTWHAKAGSNEQILGYSLDGHPITRLYKGGRLPRSHPNIGRIDLLGALEQSSNIYFSILAGDCIHDPSLLIQAAKGLSFGEKTGIELPGEIAGALPDDIADNRTGLYSFAIGQHSLVVTPLQTAVMLSTIANTGEVIKPKIVQLIAGQEPLREYRDPFHQVHYPFEEDLSLIGISFPLFTSTQSETNHPYIWYKEPEIKRSLPFSNEIRSELIEGMSRVINGLKGTARPHIIRGFYAHPEWKNSYLELKSQLVGKTGTAEILYKHTIDAESEAHIQNHIWFGGLSFGPDLHEKWDNPELAISVLLRFSEAGGKEAAPLAALIVKKWREICKKHGVESK